MRKQKKVRDLVTNEWFNDLALLARWDKMGRIPHWVPRYDRIDIIDRLKFINNGA